MKRIEYFETKKYIKSLCKDSVVELCNNVGLNEYESQLILHINRDSTRVYTAMSVGVCESKISKDNKKIMTKIFDHLKRQQ